ncbi:MAG: 3,4-dihydroxy-2-butanone-4-phosphate synthase [bacterium]|nr:3,4-dihydroxy-2-butanone-4-phosphate synthase [bacterium]
MNKIDKILKDVIDGKPIIIVDDEDREYEGDFMIAAEKATKKSLNFGLRYCRGLFCAPASGKTLDRLNIPMMVTNSTCKLGTPFTVSFDCINGCTTGMSVFDKLKTVAVLVDDNSKAEELARPGHVFGLRPKDNLLKDRRGHTEGSVEVCRLAKIKEVSVIIETMGNNGVMLKGSKLDSFAKTFGLNIVSIEEIYQAVYGKS